MFGLPSLRIGKIFGIPVEVNASWLVIFALVAMTLAFNYYPQFGWSRSVSFASSVVTTLLFFASVVAHEMSHSVVARAGGLRINRVTLFLFGGVAEMAEEPHGPGREFAMAVAGPAMSLVLAGLFLFAYRVLAVAGVSDIVWRPVQYLWMINAIVAAFNLLPGFPLDGGRVLRSFLWAVSGDLLKATLWASRAGQLIGFAMIGIAGIFILGGRFDFVWFGLLGFFLTVLSESAYRQQLAKSRLSTVAVAEIMSSDPVVVPGEITLEQLAQDYFLGGKHSRYPVVSEGRVIGLVSLTSVKGVPREEWSSRTVAEIAARDLAQLTVDAATDTSAILGRLGSELPGALLVVRDGYVVGIVTKSDVLSRLRAADISK